MRPFAVVLAGIAPLVIACGGPVTAAEGLTASEASLEFGEVVLGTGGDTSVARAVAFTNHSGARIENLSFTLVSERQSADAGIALPAFALDAPGSPLDPVHVEPGEVIALVVEFAPRSAGTFDAELWVKTPDAADLGVRVNLRGTARMGEFDGGVADAGIAEPPPPGIDAG